MSTPAAIRNICAVDLLRTAWKNQPDQEDLAVSSIQVALQIQDFDDAIQTSADLLAKTNNPKTRSQAIKLRAQALNAYLLSDKNQGDYNWNHVKDAFEAELKLPDYEVADAITLADVYRNPNTNIKNDQRDKLVAALLDRVIAERSYRALGLAGSLSLPHQRAENRRTERAPKPTWPER